MESFAGDPPNMKGVLKIYLFVLLFKFIILMLGHYEKWIERRTFHHHHVDSKELKEKETKPIVVPT